MIAFFIGVWACIAIGVAAFCACVLWADGRMNPSRRKGDQTVSIRL